MRSIEQVYVGVRECERGRIAIVIMVHMLFVARQSGACAYESEARLWDTLSITTTGGVWGNRIVDLTDAMNGCVSCE